MLIQQGEDASWVGFLLEGSMDVFVGGNKVAAMGVGAILGCLRSLKGNKGGKGGQDVIGAISFEALYHLHESVPNSQ